MKHIGKAILPLLASALAIACSRPAAPLPSPSPSIPPDAVLFAAGDALLTRVPGRRLAANGHDHIFSRMRDYIRSADAAFLNLETPISTRGVPFPGKPANVTFRADPIAAFALKDAGFDVVSLANNHMNDHGPLAVEDTLDYLDLIGIARSGAGRNEEEARRPAIVRAGAWRVAFLSYVQPWWSVTRATADSPGVAHAVLEDMVADIAAVKASGQADVVAVSVHWGDEHATKPNAYQTELARACVDSGADLVLGHHPHVLQGMERRGKGVILYSLGNFVFDMDSPYTYETVAAFITLGSGGIGRVELLPVLIERSSSRPGPAEGADRRRIAERFTALSAALGTELSDEGGRLVSAPAAP